MKLLIDIGNSRIKSCCYDHKNGFGDLMVLEHKGLSDEDLQAHYADLDNINEVWLGCVSNPDLVARLNQLSNELWGCEVSQIQVTAQVAGISNGYEALEQLGVDRWLAVIGARSLVREGALVCVDIGTAATVDYLDIDNVFQGGVIIPGPKLMLQALHKGTHGVRAADAARANIFGKTTNECVNSGIKYGLAGAIQSIAWQMRDSQPASAAQTKIIITGGAAKALEWSEEFMNQAIFDDLLVLRGIKEVSECAS